MSIMTPPIAAPPPSPPRRRSRWLVAMVVLAVLAAVGIAVTVTFAVRIAESLSQETTTETVPGVHELVIESDEGRVSLRHGDGTDIEVRTTRVWSSDSHPTLDRRLDAGVLTLSSSCPWINLGCEVNREIVVPAGTAVRVRTVDGPVEADRLVTPKFDASTVDGRVTASFGQPPEHVSIRSVDGSVSLTLPAASYRVEATTVDGRARVDVPDDPSATREISVSTVDGRIDVLRG
jgi:hypothetical protein